MTGHTRRDIRYGIAWIAGIATGLLVIGLIMVPPVIGVADNGDFGRVLTVSGLRVLHPELSYDELYFNYAYSRFGYGAHMAGGYVSTHVILIALAGWIGRLVNGEVFDIRVLGAGYAALFAMAVALLVRHLPSASSRKGTFMLTAGSAVVILFVFGDIGYTAYFQSFFGEPYAYIAMLLMLAAALSLSAAAEPNGKLLALFAAAAIAVATSKIQNAPLGFAFALLAWRMTGLRSDRRWQRQVWTVVGVLIVISALMIVVAPNRLKHTNLYQSIFYGVLKDSPNVARDMKELGIPDKYAALAGTNYFQKDTVIPQSDPVLHREVLERLSHRDIVAYYLRHPSRFVQKLDKAAANAMYIRPAYLGNYDPSAGKPPRTLSDTFNGWSRFKTETMPRRAWMYVALFLAYCAALAWIWAKAASRRIRLGAETLFVVALAGIFSWIIPLIGDGEADLGKHLFMFNVCFDMMGISAVIGIAYVVIKLAERRLGIKV
jgi:hypothetical protein